MRTVITVDETRRRFRFRFDRAVEGWRVCIVDTVDELNPNAATRCLKFSRSRRSNRCSFLSAMPLAGAADHSVALPKVLLRRSPPPTLLAPPPGRNIAIDDPALGRRQKRRRECRAGSNSARWRRPQNSTSDSGAAGHPAAGHPRELHALGDALGGSDRVALSAFIDSVDRWVGERCMLTTSNANAKPAPLARLAEVWKRSFAPRATPRNTILNENRWFSLCFGLLAEATR